MVSFNLFTAEFLDTEKINAISVLIIKVFSLVITFNF
ncbi:hypothetical protein SAMN05444372_11293 [Flavobacterium micromati]|uniref:Uncharacterized protein n=1 Tax=Flavobacterium micromati TaxID=229205 RepID=A0A1M5P972_9FLAO|nr:hypothetical protein SAMN05444372_11293 [Flavobacterium micromati]